MHGEIYILILGSMLINQTQANKMSHLSVLVMFCFFIMCTN